MVYSWYRTGVTKLRPIPPIVVYKRFGTAMLKYKDLWKLEFVGAGKSHIKWTPENLLSEEGSWKMIKIGETLLSMLAISSLNEEDFGHHSDPFNGLYHLEQK